jgi:hypothetical protein
VKSQFEVQHAKPFLFSASMDHRCNNPFQRAWQGLTRLQCSTIQLSTQGAVSQPQTQQSGRIEAVQHLSTTLWADEAPLGLWRGTPQ